MSACISVIVPVYNVEKYLHECIDSILNQTFRDFELILVDDGSPDNSGRICDEYAQMDDRIIVIHQENRGVSGARNTGLDKATGEYITFIDSDDVVSDVYLESLLAIQDEDTDIVACDYQAFKEIEEVTLHSGKIALYCTQTNGKQIILDIYKRGKGMLVTVWGKLYRSETIGRIRFPEGKNHEDQVFTPIVCYNASKVKICDDRLYWYRSRPDSIMSTSFSVKRYDDIWANEYCIDYFLSKNELDIVSAIRKRRQFRLATYTILAKRDNVKIPKCYRMNIMSAIWYIRNNLSDQPFEYYLAQIHPKLALFHEYYRKIKQILHLA